MIISNISISGIATPAVGCYFGLATSPVPFSIKSGETKPITFTCTLDATKANGKVKYAFDLNYTYSDSTFAHSMAGELFAKAS